MPTRIDTLIIGQGLAGTVLAWNLLWRGESLLLIDDSSPMTASRVAAGLVTPITGQRLVPSWRFAELWPAAVDFYRKVEQTTGGEFFREIPMLRLFQNDQERLRFEQSSSWPVAVHQPDPLVDEAAVRNEQGGFEMIGGQLDVMEFLSASRDWFAARESYRTARLDLETDVLLQTEGISIPRWHLAARRVIFCQGFAARQNPWFHRVPFDPAKGEILTIRIRGFRERRVIHRGIWLAPLGGELFRAGATYDRDNLDAIPTATGRAEICHQLQQFLRLPFEVVDHHAAVRPILLGRHPAVGRHPEFPQIGYFNGLGSKGTLQAPFVARQFARFLQGEENLDDSLNLLKRFGEAPWSD